ncbi:hypothetical protein R1flu_004699 [Riccia fluitans]|uniref:Transmembrane protein n=1 Tax=Riccia fluitans TaxID=41844 RepID=A0ABD1YRW4_9MARC
MADEPPASVFAQKLQKDIGHIGTFDVFKVSLKIFENHAKALVTPTSQVLAILNTVVLSAWALVLLLYLDHDLPLPAGVHLQTILLASSVRIDEQTIPVLVVIIIMINFGFLSVILSIWQSQFTLVVGRIYTAQRIPHGLKYPFKELLITEAWTCPLLLVTFMVFAFFIRFLALSLHPTWNWMALPVALLASAVSATALIGGILISQLATVVCFMASYCEEEVYGRAAVWKAAQVLKGRWRVGLGLAGIHGGAMLLMGSNLLRPGFAAGIGTRMLFSSFQIFLFSIWRQLAYLSWVVFYISCRALHQDYIDIREIQLDSQETRIESYGTTI